MRSAGVVGLDPCAEANPACAQQVAHRARRGRPEDPERLALGRDELHDGVGGTPELERRGGHDRQLVGGQRPRRSGRDRDRDPVAGGRAPLRPPRARRSRHRRARGTSALPGRRRRAGRRRRPAGGRTAGRRRRRAGWCALGRQPPRACPRRARRRSGARGRRGRSAAGRRSRTASATDDGLSTSAWAGATSSRSNAAAGQMAQREHRLDGGDSRTRDHDPLSHGMQRRRGARPAHPQPPVDHGGELRRKRASGGLAWATMRILVTAASKYGSTAEIAATIETRLRERGLDADVRPRRRSSTSPGTTRRARQRRLCRSLARTSPRVRAPAQLGAERAAGVAVQLRPDREP